MGRMKWNGRRALELIQAEMVRRLHAASIIVSNHAKRLVGREGAVLLRDAQKNRDARGRFVKSLKYNIERSRPGEPPRKQTGTLQSGIQREVNAAAMTARVGTNKKNPPYPRWLELGTRKMAPRPWLRRSLDENRERIRAIFAKRMRLPDE